TGDSSRESPESPSGARHRWRAMTSQFVRTLQKLTDLGFVFFRPEGLLAGVLKQLMAFRFELALLFVELLVQRSLERAARCSRRNSVNELVHVADERPVLRRLLGDVGIDARAF